MTITLDLKPAAATQLVARAQEEGLPVETYLSRVVERLLTANMLDEEEFYVEDEPPVIVPKEVGRMEGYLVYAGKLVPPPIDEEDWIDIDA